MSIALWLVTMAIIGAGLWAHHRASRIWELATPAPPRLPAPTRRARRSTLLESKPGDHVAVLGTIASAEDLRGPLSGRPCVAYDLLVIDAATRDPVGRSVRGHAFVIEDNGGRAVVAANNADLRLWPDRPTYVHDPSQHESIVAVVGASPSRPVYVYEGRLTRGQEVLVIGVVHEVEAVDGAAYRSVPATARLALTASDEVPLVISDRIDDRGQFAGPGPSTMLI